MEEQYQHGCPPDAILLNVTSLPTTALVVLLENGQIIPGIQRLQQQQQQQQHNNDDIRRPLDNLYFSTNLASLPDISNVGRDFYTLYYQLDIPPPPFASSSSSNEDSDHSNHDIFYCRHGDENHDDDDDDDSMPVRATRRTLRFAGINYRATAWLNGLPLVELHDDNKETVAGSDATTEPWPSSPSGMFRRRSYDVTNGGRFVMRIDPPDHPGTGNCTTATPDSSCGQGGNHEAAKDGTTPQFMLGWDWW
jgi:hypothetical protein